MKDFDAWARELAQSLNPAPPKWYEKVMRDGQSGYYGYWEDDEVPDDVMVSLHTIQVRCCCCGKWKEMLRDPEDHLEGHYYCGGSPRCCP